MTMSIDVFSRQTRRAWLGKAGAFTLWPLPRAFPGGAFPPRAECTLSIGTYSLKGLGLAASVDLLVEIGYDAIEIDAQPGAAGEPSRLSKQARASLGKQLGDTGLLLSSLMENMPPSRDATAHQNDLARLARVMELARDLALGPPPLVQTVLGPGQWAEQKELFRDRLGDWQRVAEDHQVVLAIKPHRFGAMSRPEEAIWLIQQLGDSPRLRMVYDYSHYAFRDMPLADSIQIALPYTAHIALKGAVQRQGKVDFVLPGEGDGFDYPSLLRQFHGGGYRGDFCVEVSAMVSQKPEYDPVAAAKSCYRNMASAFEAAGVPRTSKS